MFISVSIVNGERFTGLNFRGFHPMKIVMGKLLWCFTFKALKQCHYTKLIYIHGKASMVLLKTVKFSPANPSLFVAYYCYLELIEFSRRVSTKHINISHQVDIWWLKFCWSIYPNTKGLPTCIEPNWSDTNENQLLGPKFRLKHCKVQTVTLMNLTNGQRFVMVFPLNFSILIFLLWNL